MVAANAYDLTHSALIFYIKFLISQNFIFIFFIIFIIFFIVNKKIRKNKQILIPATISIAYLIYLSTLVHFENRYIFVAIPFFAIIASISIKELLSKIKNNNIKKYIFIAITIFLIVQLILSYTAAIKITQKSNNEYQTISNYYNYFKNKDVNLVGVDDPLFEIFNNNYKVFYLAVPEFVNKNLEKYSGQYQYIAYSQKDFVCWKKEFTNCEKEVTDFKNTLKNYKLVYKSNFQGSDHYIYKVN